MNVTVDGSDGVAHCTDDSGSSVLPTTKTGNEKKNIFKRAYISPVSTV